MGEKMKHQHPVLKYKIDLYFPAHNFAIESDENNHKDRNMMYEKTRQDKITKKIKCIWIRYNPDAMDFDILES